MVVPALQWSRSIDRWYSEHSRGMTTAPVVDVLIIGSGYGGSFAAKEFAKAGHSVVVMERGREYALGEFPEDIGALPGHVRIRPPSGGASVGNADGLFEMRNFDQVSVLVANGLGGGSLINAGVALRPARELLDQGAWPVQYRKPGLERDALWQAMSEVELQLQAQPLSDARDLLKFKALDVLAGSMGSKACPAPLTIASVDQTSPAGIAQKACTRCGNCFTGCNVGAKNTLITHVLPDAHALGAEFVTGATALEVIPLAHDSAASKSGLDTRWRVRMMHTRGQSNAATKREFDVLARTVIVCAGTLGSTEILLNSPLVKASSLLGSRFSTNGDLIALGWGMKAQVNGMASPETNTATPLPPQDRAGPTITGVIRATIDIAQGGKRAVLIQDGAIPSALAQATVALGATLSLPHRYTGGEGPGFFPARWNTDRLATPRSMAQHSMLLLGMGPDDADGVISVRNLKVEGKKDTKYLHIQWSQKGQGPASPYYQAFDKWFSTAQAAPDGGGFQGGDYLPNPMWRALPQDFNEIAGGNGPAQSVSVHPLGGCPMGDDIASGVVDWRGTVFNRDGGTYAGLHVLDGAILPTAVGVNPFLTISALSLLASRSLAEEPGHPMTPQKAVLTPEVKQQARVAKEAPEHKESVQLQFQEHLQGFWKGATPTWLPPLSPGLTESEQQRAWIVAVDVQLDVDKWLDNPSMKLEGAHLRVYRNPRPQDMTVHPDACSGTPELEGTGWVSLLALDAPQSQWAQWWRMLLALRTFVQRRGFGELFELATKQNANPEESRWAGAWRRVTGFYRAARNLSYRRELVYNFDLHLNRSPQYRLKAHGKKCLAYAPDAKNVWAALIEIDIQVAPANGEKPAMLSLTVDLVDMVRNHRLQVKKAAHTPVGIVALAAFSALWVRVLFQSHFWSFKGLNYELLKPPAAAEHGLLKGANLPVRIPLQVPRHQASTTSDLLTHELLTLELTRYEPANSKTTHAGYGQHLLMVHGLAHGGTVFTTDTTGGNNMAAAFVAQGYTVWVLDHRLSNRLPYHGNDHCMDDVAALDIPAAVNRVYSEAGQPIVVFAHCVGAGAFAMATLKGWLNDSKNKNSMVAKAIIHAVHPWVVPSASNQLSGSLAALYKDFLPQNLSVNPVPPSGSGSILDQALDRISASLPWPESERELHSKDQFDPMAGTATCNRMTLFYGREWVHANLNAATHRELASLVGPASVEVFRQLFFIINRQRLTNRDGANVYMHAENFAKHWTFPTLFAHGNENKVFDPRSAVRTWGRMRQMQCQRPPRIFVADGYGHMDFLFGQNAHVDVYPHLCQFLADPENYQSSWNADVAPDSIPGHLRDNDTAEHKAPLTGPHIRLREVQGAATPQRALEIWAEFANDPALPDASPLLQDAAGKDLAGWRTTKLSRLHRDPALDKDVTLLNGPGTFWIGTLLESSSCQFKTLGSMNLVKGPKGALGKAELDWHSLCWWKRWTGQAVQAPVSWLAVSCRWPGTPFEGESIDAMSLAMLSHVTTHHLPVDGLIMLGDQIYADATANIFEVRETDELLAGMYRDAWGTPHTRTLLANLPSYSVVDDHEYGDNWSGAENHLTDKEFVNGFEAAFAYQWRKYEKNQTPHSAQPEITNERAEGFWEAFKVGGLNFFAADTRTERGYAPWNKWRERKMMGAKQLSTLKQWLLGCKEGPKVICSGTVFGFVEHEFLSPGNEERCLTSDSWYAYPTTWRDLVAFIVQNQIQNVIFLSGDYHLSGVAELTLSAAGKADVRALSVVSSGWNASLPFINATSHDFVLNQDVSYPLSDDAVSLTSKATVLSTAYRQFSKLTLELLANRWQLTTRIYGADGQPLAKASLTL